jgi:DMSO/TMAO reductase YedYZ heme-binding membrane subunit
MAGTLFSLRASIIFSLAVALVLLVLLTLLTVTSFNAVKKRMDSGRWKSLQHLAYPFFGLIYFHMLGYLLVPALEGSTRAIIGVTVYAVIFAAYTVLRVRRAVIDRRDNAGNAADRAVSPVEPA